MSFEKFKYNEEDINQVFGEASKQDALDALDKGGMSKEKILEKAKKDALQIIEEGREHYYNPNQDVDKKTVEIIHKVINFIHSYK